MCRGVCPVSPRIDGDQLSTVSVAAQSWQRPNSDLLRRDLGRRAGLVGFSTGGLSLFGAVIGPDAVVSHLLGDGATEVEAQRAG